MINTKKITLGILAIILCIGTNTYSMDIFKAIKKGNIESIKIIILNEKIDVNKADKFGFKPLYRACRNNELEIVKLLLPHCTKETINQNLEFNRTPLYWAFYHKNLEMVKLLLENGKLDEKSIKVVKKKLRDQTKYLMMLKETLLAKKRLLNYLQNNLKYNKSIETDKELIEKDEEILVKLDSEIKNIENEIIKTTMDINKIKKLKK